MIGKAWKFCWNKLCAGLLSSNGWPHSLKSKPKSPSKWCLCSHPKLHPWENWHIHRYPTFGKGKSSSNMPYQGDMFMARHNYSIWSSHLRLDLQGNGGLGEQGWGHCYRLPRPLTTRLEISSRGRISVHWSYLQAPWVPKVGGRDPGPHRVRISDSRIGQEKMQENNRKHPLTREPPPVISRVITPLKGVTAPVIHLWRHLAPFITCGDPFCWGHGFFWNNRVSSSWRFLLHCKQDLCSNKLCSTQIACSTYTPKRLNHYIDSRRSHSMSCDDCILWMHLAFRGYLEQSLWRLCNKVLLLVALSSSWVAKKYEALWEWVQSPYQLISMHLAKNEFYMLEFVQAQCVGALNCHV